jgi:pyridoxamine 5'-phosphate oxidase
MAVIAKSLSPDMSPAMTPEFAALRKDYTAGGLTESEAGSDPMLLFRTWFDLAVSLKINEPNAMTLATVGPDGKPSARMVLLKGIDHGFTFFTNYNSRKAAEMAAHSSVALVFWWYELERQVRIEGVAEKVTVAESDEYYAVRPLGSRLGAWASPQSSVIAGREVLEAEQTALMAKHADGVVPRPDHWGGYRVVPEVIEFWQGRRSRLHDRVRFSRHGDGWQRDRLAP